MAGLTEQLGRVVYNSEFPNRSPRPPPLTRRRVAIFHGWGDRSKWDRENFRLPQPLHVIRPIDGRFSVHLA